MPISGSNPRSTAQIAGHPIHPMLVTFPIAFLVGTFVSDIVYRSTLDPFWASASFWLLAAGIVMALVAALMGFIDLFSERRIRETNAVWWHMGVNLVAVILSVINLFPRYAGDHTGFYPAGLWLSLLVVLLLLFTGWKGGELVYKHHVGVSDVQAPPDRADAAETARRNMTG